MELLLWIAAAIVLALGVMLLFRRNEIFCVSIRNGTCLEVRGRVPPSLMREIRAVARMSEVRRGQVRAVRGDGHARLVFDGIDEGTAQRLRNAVGSAGLSRMKVSANEAHTPRNLGQILGVVWLAWFLGGRA